MKYHYFALAFLILIMVVPACTKSADKRSGVQIPNDHVMTVVKDKLLIMGEYDYPTSGTIGYYEKNGKSYIAQCNERTRSVAIYDYDSGEKVKDILVGDWLPNGDLFCYNEDTILSSVNSDPVLLSLYAKETVYSVEVPVNVHDGHIEQYPGFFPYRGAFANGKWYISCYRLGEYPELMHAGRDRFSVLEVDFITKQYQYIGGYPELYAHNNMGTLNYWIPNHTINPHTNQLIITYRASPEMHIYSLDNKNEEIVAVKSLFADTIPLPLTEKGRDYFSDEDSYYYYAQYSHYGPICYDQWKRVYYRFIGVGLNDWSLEKDRNLQNKKCWSIMIMDEQFNKIGEEYIGDVYNTAYHFVTSEGLYLLKRSKDEDVASYSLFTINK